jgi:5-methylthioadenosine/S-adenosylhomocysteine deaminase
MAADQPDAGPLRPVDLRADPAYLIFSPWLEQGRNHCSEKPLLEGRLFVNILIKGCLMLADSQDGIERGDIAIEGGRLLKVGASGQVPDGWQPERVIDGGDHLCLPGLINCHTHAAMTLFRSYADDLPLMEWLQTKIWPAEDRMTGDDAYWATLLAIIEMIKSGTTTFNDQYMFMEEVARAVTETGIRAVLSRGLSGVGASAERGLEESRCLIERWQGGAGGRITVWLGPHAPYTCPPAYMEKVLQLAREYRVGIHIHVAETAVEVEQIRGQYGKTPVKYLQDLGVFRFPVLAAHCVHLTGDDLVMLADGGVAVAHNPESNLKLASGAAPVVAMRKTGITVGLGTDGAASNNNLDLFEEMRTAALLQKLINQDALALPAREALLMATGDGARALGLGSEVGALKPGYKADLIMIDLNQAHLCPRHNLAAHLVYSARGSDVDTVIIDGRLVMESRKMLTVDEDEVRRQVERRANKLVGG